MSTVVISDRLVRDVRAKIAEVYNPRIQAAQKVPADWAMRIYDLMLPQELLDKMGVLPRDYFKWTNAFAVTTSTKTFSVTFPDGVSRPFPLKMDPKVNKVNESYHGYELREALWGNTPIYLEISDWSANIRRLEAEKQEMTVNAEKALRANRTLAPTLKQWPALWSLLPKAIQDKHLTVNKKKERTVGTVDTEALKGLSVALTVHDMMDAKK